jgi:head-tail adaptor
MNLGDIMSVLSEGLYNGFQATSSGSLLPGFKVTVTLQELTVTSGTTGGQVRTYTTVQDMSGSFRELNGKEIDLYEKQSVKADYRFLVSGGVFTSSTNKAKLVEKNRIQYLGVNYNITFVENRTEGMLPHYKVLLQKVI